MKTIQLFLFSIIFSVSYSQKILSTSSGEISFEASVKLFEEITAKNKKVITTFEPKTGKIKCQVPMAEFRFKLPLMEEHFNKHYLETDKYPKANFEGRIENLKIEQLGTSAKEFKMIGDLKIHGKRRPIATTVTIKKNDNKLTIDSSFNIKLKDFDVSVPEILRMKIAEIVQISSSFNLQ